MDGMGMEHVFFSHKGWRKNVLKELFTTVTSDSEISSVGNRLGVFGNSARPTKTWWNSGYFVNLVAGLSLKTFLETWIYTVYSKTPSISKDEISVLTVVGIKPSTREAIYISKFALDPTHTNSKYLRMYSGTHTTIFSSNARFSIVSKEAAFENMATHVVKKKNTGKNDGLSAGPRTDIGNFKVPSTKNTYYPLVN